MNILLGVYNSFNCVLNISSTLERMGHTVTVINIDGYQDVASYLSRKIDKLGVHGRHNDFRRSFNNRISELVLSVEIDFVLFIDVPERVMTIDEIQSFSNLCHSHGKKVILWLVDPVGNAIEHYNTICRFFDGVYSFETKDVAEFNKNNIPDIYCPVGCNYAYRGEEEYERDIDIFFCGCSRKSRNRFLEAAAIFAKRKKLNMKVCGNFWEKIYPWKKLFFAIKHQQLYHYIDNGYFLPNKVAEFYRRSKICLNVNGDERDSMNPRSFEIMATGAFHLTDERRFYGDMVPGEHLATYKDPDDMICQIEYYLTHEKERKRIARNGMELVREKYSLENSLNQILLDL